MVIDSRFWLKEIIKVNYIFYYVGVISAIIVLFFADITMLINAKFKGKKSESWWTVHYSYWRYLNMENWQKKIYCQNINNDLSWYNYQFNKQIMNWGWIIFSIILYTVYIYVYIQIFFFIIFRSYYYEYWISGYWLINSISKEELLIGITLYLLIKIIWLKIFAWYSEMNSGVYIVGVITKKMFWHSNVYISYQTDFRYWFCYDKKYQKIWRDKMAYEFPGYWWNWNLMVIDCYYNENIDYYSLISRIIKFFFYSWVKKKTKYSRQVAMFSYNYNYLCLEQEIDYYEGKMRNDVIGLITMFYKERFFKMDIRKNIIYLLIDKYCVRSFLSILRYSSIFYGTTFHDISGVSINNSVYLDKSIVIYMFYLPKWNIKINIFVNATPQVALASEFFSGAAWAERECSEMLGINFMSKIDSRKLLLDYICEGNPLLKKYNTSGYEEIEYNIFNNWITYNAIKMRDEVSVW